MIEFTISWTVDSDH